MQRASFTGTKFCGENENPPARNPPAFRPRPLSAGGKNQPKFCKILFLQKRYTFRFLITKRSRSCKSVPPFLTPKNSFCKTSSALFRHLPKTLRARKRILGASARLIEGFCERSETKDPMSGQLL